MIDRVMKNDLRHSVIIFYYADDWYIYMELIELWTIMFSDSKEQWTKY